MGEKEIIWDVKARNTFNRLIDHIKKDSFQSAENVMEDIFKIIDDLPDNPEKFNADKFKTENDGNFRAFENHSIRIAYFITEKHIRILRVRHIRQEPKQY